MTDLTAQTIEFGGLPGKAMQFVEDLAKTDGFVNLTSFVDIMEHEDGLELTTGDQGGGSAEREPGQAAVVGAEHLAGQARHQDGVVAMTDLADMVERLEELERRVRELEGVPRQVVRRPTLELPMRVPAACACVGRKDGEPHCPCKMARLHNERLARKRALGLR